VTTFLTLAAQTVRLGVRVGGSAIVGLIFFLAVVMVVPFGVGPDLKLLARIGSAILWIAALLASLLGLERLFSADREDGTLDLFMVSGEALIVYALARAAGHWFVTGLPIVIAAPILGLLLNLEPLAMASVALTLLVGTPALTLIGSVGAALTAALPRGGTLIAVLVLPLTIPVLIFGVLAASGAVSEPDPFVSPFLILCALTLISLVLAPVAAAAALRLSLE
jgi:heme exporter protein B